MSISFKRKSVLLEDETSPSGGMLRVYETDCGTLTSPSSHRKMTPKLTPQVDRFIPNRHAMDLDVARFSLLNSKTKENISNTAEVDSPVKEEYRTNLERNVLQDAGPAASGDRLSIFNFRERTVNTLASPDNPLQSTMDSLVAVKQDDQKPRRTIPRVAEKVLDAPDMVDDFYLNLLDWGPHNVLAVALGTCIYLWNADTGDIQQLLQTRESGDYVTSVAWAQDGCHLAVGLNSSEVQLWNTSSMQQVRRMDGHLSRVGSLAWNKSLLSSGSREGAIVNHDIRMREHIVSRLSGHSFEVCGLQWAPSGRQLASGGNDNLLHIWDLASATSARTGEGPGYLHRLEQHLSAVKALAWCPFKSHLLASGGGTADRTIKFWDTQSGACLNSIDTGSQVCALQWNRHEREIMSSHGFSRFELAIWRYPSMTRVAELTGHSARVLHLAQSPDGCTVASAAGDETLRFWKAFGANQRSHKGDANKPSAPNAVRSSLSAWHIR